MHVRFSFTRLVAALVFLSLAGGATAAPYIVVDAGSGRVLAESEPFRRWYPASLTKLMTTYTVFRAIRAGEITLQSPVVVSANAAAERPSKMGYPKGSVLTIDNAIKILMVKSANDIATAVAESVGGSERAFAARMNTEAQRLGMTGSHWVNAHGWHDDNQYTTARDMAILATAIRREFPQYDGYFSIEAIQSGRTVMNNHNSLIGRFEGADGMKTGYTCPSGFNLVASAERRNRRVIAVVLGAESVEERAETAADLLHNGFRRTGFGAPRLEQMRPSGTMLTQATNMRPVICTSAARAERAANRDEQGRRVIRSPYMTEFNRPRRIVQVGLGGAVGVLPAAAQIANVPIPTPRPDYTPLTAEGG
ncbi:MAG: D-alanyl-D-alanine carboxypeptidase [Rhizobiaceae bacterium]|nr:D-alanyl-D-alanine carboxypeptidase [Rhizobiaceae bacterium]